MSLSTIAFDCQWSSWVYGTCSKGCGSGTQIRNRTIKVQVVGEGLECEGQSYEILECNTQPCAGIISSSFNLTKRSFWDYKFVTKEFI